MAEENVFYEESKSSFSEEETQNLTSDIYTLMFYGSERPRGERDSKFKMLNWILRALDKR